MRFRFGCLLLCGIVILLTNAQGHGEQFRVAALFEDQFESMRRAFDTAMSKANVYPIGGSSWKILPHLTTLTPNDSFEADRKICKEIKAGIAAIFGPITEIPRAHVQSLSTAFEIPHVQAHFDPRESRDYDYTISLYPDLATIGRGFSALINYWDWKEFTVIYENNEGLIRLQEVLKIARGDDFRLTVRKLPVSHRGYVALLKEMKQNNEYRVLVDCDLKTVSPLLTQAMTVGMLSEYYHYHFTTLDLEVLDLDKFIHSHANITAMQLIDPDNPRVAETMSDWKMAERSNTESPLMGQRGIMTETALMYDAVNLFVEALTELRASSNVSTTSLSCNKKETWREGQSLLNYMKGRVHNGLSGTIKFSNGRRLDITLGVIRLTKNGLVRIGQWHPLSGVNITENFIQKAVDDLEALRNKTLKVVTVVDSPYAIKRETPDARGRNIEGFIVDLLDLLQERIGFKYTIEQQKENAYGSLENGKWTGIVGDLMERDTDRVADLGAAGMTITYERAKVVEFTTPFLNLGITIIFKKAGTKPADLFSFLYPLSLDVWIYMMAAYLCVSFMLFVIARFTPYEWENPHPCNEDSEVVENQFTILNCLWFTIGSLMQQGSDVAPKACSTRFVASVWYLFTLILVSSYTANLAAFLTTKRMETPVKNAADLADQSTIKYGTLKSGSTNNFFKVSNFSTYKRMWSYMSANPEVLVKTNNDGFERVMTENYAYIAESTTIDYQVQRNCDLVQIGDLLDSKGYGLAMPKDSPYLKFISREIIYLQQRQNISKLYEKWWKEKSGVKCSSGTDDKKKSSLELGIENVGGVFIVLMGGSVFGVFLSFLEFLWKTKKNAEADKQSFFSEMLEELRFVVRCKTTKTLRRTPSKEMIDNGQLSTLPNNKLTHRDVFD